MPYRHYTLDERQRVLTAAQNLEDWTLVARLNDVTYPTAARWVATARKTNMWTAVESERGGARHVKITPERVNFLIALLENNCQLTLNDMIDELKVSYGVDVTAQTVRNALDSVCFSIKKIHAEPSAMNTPRVKALRREYVIKIMKAQSQRKRILYFDETNFNLFCSRTCGWIRRGTRAVVVRPGPKGDNLSMIACISAQGLERAEFRWGTNNADVIDSFAMGLLDGLMDKGVSMFDVVVVCDNASIHTNVEEITRRAEYAGAQFINLSPYSPMLNPIENVFSVFKSEVKAFLAAKRDEILCVPPNQTKAAHRASYLLRAAKYSMSVKVTPDLCDTQAAHTLSFHAAALDENDMLVGS